MTPFENISIFISNQSIGRNLTRIGKRRIRIYLKKKSFKSPQYKNMIKSAQSGYPTKIMHKQNYPSRSGNMPGEPTNKNIEKKKKGSLKCCGCGGECWL
jgi:hypothetical protein